MINILLGVVGTFWIRTEARKGEMGVRVALGSTRHALKGIMLLEALLLLAIIWIPAILVCINLGYMDIIGSLFNLEFTWPTAIISIGITTAVMILMIILGAIYPAYEATAIEPAEALHYE
ncbi:MAG: FtsX-like permease family protein [Tannerellaceae bacterium]|nr:FtsX-like permease family protein [Tannerellaceae bacterium]